MKPGQIIKKFISKKGKEVIIRSLKQEDLDDLLAFANGLIAEDTFIMLNGKKITYEEERKYLKDGLEKIKKGQKIQLVVMVNGKFAGSAEVRRYERRKSHVGDVGISLAKEYREEGIGTELLKIIIEEGKKLGLRLLTISCMEGNDRALYVYGKLGFVRCGMIPEALEYKNKYVGEIHLSLPLKGGK